MSSPLLTTKLYIPQPQTALVARPRLMEKLDGARQTAARLILVSAPAGFGKSTLVAAWLARHSAPAAWLSLDEQDNDRHQFLTYLIAALQRAQPGFGADLLPQLSSGVTPTHDLIITLLVNHLAQARSPLLVILDDYQAITNPAVHEALTLLLERAPTPVTFILITRVTPPLPLARWRAQRQLVEIRLPDLRFTRAETTALLNDHHALALAPPDIDLLEDRTEGWVAGLQLAALALQAEGDHQAFLAQFSGSHEFIADYLAEEVLGRQPPVATDFLLRSAILDRFCAPLCTAVTGNANSEALLLDLLARNVFLIPLDAERRWFRYHHLFADLLRAHLQRRHPALVADLHRQASEWLAANGLVDEAITHALAANDWTTAVRLIGNNWPALLHQGQVGAILRWLAPLPDRLFATEPDLNNAYAWALFVKGQYQDVERHLQQAENDLAGLRQQGRLAETAVASHLTDASVQTLHAFLLYVRREFNAAYEQAQRALPLARLAGDLLEGGLNIITAHICRELGRLAEALPYYQTGIDLSWQAGNVIAVLNAYTALSRLYRQEKQWAQAEQTCQQALHLLQTHNLEHIPAAGLLYLEQATLLWAQNRLPEARVTLATAVAVARASGLADFLAACDALNARLEQANSAAATPSPHRLTTRELEVLALLAEGCSNQEIAARLTVSLPTIKKHTSSILAKLEAANRSQAVARARQQGLL